jgi:hypothetical protein
MAMVSDTDCVVRGALCRTYGARLRCVPCSPRSFAGRGFSHDISQAGA